MRRGVYIRPGKKLTDQQKRFVDEYLLDFNASAACKRAGYKAVRSDSAGSQLLANPLVNAHVEKRKADLAERMNVTQERIAAEFIKLGFSNINNYVRIDENGIPRVDLSGVRDDPHAMAAIAETGVTVNKYGENVSIKLYDKRAALVDLAKLCGMYVEEAKPPPVVDLKVYVGVALDTLFSDGRKETVPPQGGTETSLEQRRPLPSVQRSD